MRTTLDIDEDVLAAARDLSRAEGRTLGQIVSELARRGLTTPAFGPSGMAEAGTGYAADDWPLLPERPGPPVTSELIERIQEELDREDAEPWDHATGKPL